MQQQVAQQRPASAQGGRPAAAARRPRLVVRATATTDKQQQNIRSDAVARSAAGGAGSFTAKFVPFKDVQSGSLSGEQYSLDTVQYRSTEGGLLVRV